MRRAGLLTVGAALVALLAAPLTARAVDADFAAELRAAAARYPDPQARLAVGDAFLRFETSALHADIAARDAGLYRDIEGRWLTLAAEMKGDAAPAEVRAQAEALAGILARAAGTPAGGAGSLFVDGLLVILREGFEAILILAALAAYLVKVGQADKRWLLYAGAGAAIAASLALAAAAEWLIPVSGAAREALEGVTMLLAVVVLFFASYWLISKVEAQRWQAFVRSRLEGAVGSGRRRALVAVAFLVVFREGFETVLFYQALAARAGGVPAALSALGAGFALGIVLLAGIALGLFRYGVRIPVRPFFAVTGALLYILAFKFAGAGIHELQEAGLVSVTRLDLAESAVLRDWLGIYPYAEPLAAQAVLIVALVVGGLWVLSGRGARATDAAAAARP